MRLSVSGRNKEVIVASMKNPKARERRPHTLLRSMIPARGPETRSAIIASAENCKKIGPLDRY